MASVTSTRPFLGKILNKYVIKTNLNLTNRKRTHLLDEFDMRFLELLDEYELHQLLFQNVHLCPAVFGQKLVIPLDLDLDDGTRCIQT